MIPTEGKGFWVHLMVSIHISDVCSWQITLPVMYQVIIHGSTLLQVRSDIWLLVWQTLLSSNLWEILNVNHFTDEEVYVKDKLLKVEILLWRIYPVEGTITDMAKQAKIVYLFWPLKSDLGIQLKYPTMTKADWVL